MRVADAMSSQVLVVGRHHTMREAARLMTARHVGSAVVVDTELPGPGIVTERDVLRAVADGRDPETTPVSEIMTFDARQAGPDWDLDAAAAEMVQNGFRHLIVVDGDRLAGMLSMRDVVRAAVQAARSR